MKVSFTLIYRSESNQCYIRSICLNTSSLYLFQRSIPAPICSSKSFHRQYGWFHYEHSHIRAWSPDRRIRLGFVVAHAPGASPWGRTSQPTATSSSTAPAGPSRSARSSRAASSSKAASPPRTASLSNTIGPSRVRSPVDEHSSKRFRDFDLQEVMQVYGVVELPGGNWEKSWERIVEWLWSYRYLFKFAPPEFDIWSTIGDGAF